jgi:hypothetical protein
MPIVTTPGQIPKVTNPMANTPAIPTTNYTPQPPVSPTPASFTPPPPIPAAPMPKPPVAATPMPIMPNSRLQSTVKPPVTSPSPFLSDEDDDTLDANQMPPSSGLLGDDDDDSPFMPQPQVPQSAAKTGAALSRMTEDDRRAAITRSFQLVLGRDPVDRDFSYYRFSTLAEEGLVKSLLALPEHKQMIEKSREHAALKQSVSDLDLQVKQFAASHESMTQELQTMQYLLAEKNRYIQQMRGIPEGEQVILPPKPEPVPEKSKSSTAPLLQAVETKKLPTPVDEMRSMIKGLFGKK